MKSMREVMCPGCGKPMKCKKPRLHVKDTPDSLYYLCTYSCENYGCGWLAPVAEGKTAEEALQNAYNAAARRSRPSEEVDV